MDSRPPPAITARFDVALSFAGEDRDYVEKVAAALRAANVKVFYDKYEETSLWGKDLYTHLRDVYQEQAIFTVMFVSKSYATKLWTTHERESAQARAFGESREYILPARFDDAEVPGLLSTVGYIDLRSKNPQEFSELIVRKLREIGEADEPTSRGATSPTTRGQAPEVKASAVDESNMSPGVNPGTILNWAVLSFVIIGIIGSLWAVVRFVDVWAPPDVPSYARPPDAPSHARWAYVGQAADPTGTARYWDGFPRTGSLKPGDKLEPRNPTTLWSKPPSDQSRAIVETVGTGTGLTVLSTLTTEDGRIWAAVSID